jgi:hypothetical protein
MPRMVIIFRLIHDIDLRNHPNPERSDKAWK